jgi:hypothetical protein
LFSRLKWTGTQTTNTRKQTAPASSAKAAEFTFYRRKKTLLHDANSKTQSSGVLIKMPAELVGAQIKKPSEHISIMD